jgi:hypothetical protein
VRRTLFHFVAAVSMAAAGMVSAVQAGTITFGSGGNTFNMEFVTIGNPGNLADNTGIPNPAGAVGYTYGIGKFEVSVDMINKYNVNFGLDNSLEITTDQLGEKKPALSVSWNEAARFVNWLNTSTGNHAAYKFTTSGVNDNIALWDASDTLDYDPLNPYRSKRATYVLPSFNEWYKAAYYNPDDSTYYDFTNGSDTRPTAVTDGLSGAVYTEPGEASPTGPADVDQAGGLSPYGVMGLGGNAWEWEESSVDLSNNDGSLIRGVRGGNWGNGSIFLSSSVRLDEYDPNFQSDSFGFRVARLHAVPEPSMMVIGTLFGLGGLVAKRRMKK